MATMTRKYKQDKVKIVTFDWGLDLSRSAQGAGGVGGLLATRTSEFASSRYTTSSRRIGQHFPSYDANGNIIAWTSDSGEYRTTRDFDPFGNIVTKQGERWNESTPFGFSTKYEDVESGLLYYGYRHYDPTHGRWLNRDPLGERGGVNLYGMVRNSPVSSIDRLGLALYAFDGTWNDADKMAASPDEQPTNVWYLYEAFKKTNKVEKFYYKGVGADWWSKHIGGLTGAGGKSRVRRAYNDFVKRYRKGDCQIDIIGFSRGAAQAREFANMIRRKGVQLHQGGAIVIPQIRFLGLFDTVSSHGWPGNRINIGYDLSIVDEEGIRRVAHATAADERRHFFPLTSIHSSPDDENTEDRDEREFQGAHSNVGGGYGDSDLSDVPLNWMRKKGVEVGVPFGALKKQQRWLTNPNPKTEGG